MNNVRDMLLLLCGAATLLAQTGCSRQTGERRQEVQRVRSINIDDYQWKNRPVFVFAPSEGGNRYNAQLRQFQGRGDGLEDRDIVLFLLPMQGNRSVDGSSLSNEASDFLWERFQVPREQFAVLLVGKDGGVKLRSDEPVSAQRLFDLIDSMPMRQQEMRRSR